MTPSDEGLQARLMVAAEEAIAKAMAECRELGEMKLSDIERVAREAGERVMESVTAGLVSAAAAQEEATVCPECGGKLRRKGKKGRDLVTDSGEVRLERGYFYCPSCRQGFFPPRPAVGAERDDL